jgi:NAD-dependent SIR2 family protein deacetylase
MGVDSGLPDFRGTQGFWRAYPAIANLGLRFEEMAQPVWFERSPELAWAFYGHRLNLYRKTAPHAGFLQLLDCGRQKKHGYFVFTSNVDGHFQKAGYDPERIVECHGSLQHLQCCNRCADYIWDTAGETVTVDEATFRAQSPLPSCPRCGALARPNVLMFEDWEWNPSRMRAQEARFQGWLNLLHRVGARPVVVEVGAGTALPTVRNLSERVADDFGSTLIRINPRESEVPPGQLGIPLNAAEGIHRVCGLSE